MALSEDRLKVHPGLEKEENLAEGKKERRPGGWRLRDVVAFLLTRGVVIS